MEGESLQNFIQDGHAFAVFILVLPLLSVILLLMLGKWRAIGGGWLATSLIGLAFFFSLFQVFGFNVRYEYAKVYTVAFEWIPNHPGAQVVFSTRMDALTSVMFALVTGISLLVHLFSIEYMRREPHFHRYFAYLGLFTFAMLGLVLCNDLVFIFFFWGILGFSSWLLTGFWFRRSETGGPGLKTFLITRVGDLGLLIGLLILMAGFGTTQLTNLQTEMFSLSLGPEQTSPLSRGWLITAGIALCIGALGKSAQFPFHRGLTEAMKGPLPVSALLQGSIMITAGIYLLARVHFLLLPEVRNIMVGLGSLTAFFAAITALRQYDIKKLLAWSTVSQLGLMITAIGVSEVTASLFHLITHAFFNGGLFLAAGLLIHIHQRYQHDLHQEGFDLNFNSQDLRVMGGLRHRFPKLFVLYLVMAAALVGIPFFSGALSKNALLLGIVTWAFRPGSGSGWQWVVPLLTLATSAITGYYVTRKTLLIFLGENRLEQQFPQLLQAKSKLGQVKVLLWGPIAVLALFSMGLLYNLNPFGLLGTSWWLANFPYINSLHPLPETLNVNVTHPLEWGVPLLATLLALGGTGVAWLHFRSGKWLKKAPENNRKKSAIHPYEKAFIPSLLFMARKLDLLDRQVLSFKRADSKQSPLEFIAQVPAIFDQKILEGGISKLWNRVYTLIFRLVNKLPRKWWWAVIAAGILILSLSPVVLYLILR